MIVDNTFNSQYVFVFFVKTYFYLKEREMTPTYLLLLKEHNTWAGPRTEASNTGQVFHVSGSDAAPAAITFFPQCAESGKLKSRVRTVVEHEQSAMQRECRRLCLNAGLKIYFR